VEFEGAAEDAEAPSDDPQSSLVTVSAPLPPATPRLDRLVSNVHDRHDAEPESPRPLDEL